MKAITSWQCLSVKSSNLERETIGWVIRISACLQTRLVGREGTADLVRASQEAHRESLAQECLGLRQQVGEGAVREMQLRAELEVCPVLSHR